MNWRKDRTAWLPESTSGTRIIRCSQDVPDSEAGDTVRPSLQPASRALLDQLVGAQQQGSGVASIIETNRAINGSPACATVLR
jgi:hypothetical protein